jgi:mono/diheme cytochrome c family protein
MRWTRMAAISLTSAALLLAAATLFAQTSTRAKSAAKPAASSQARQAKVIERGEYLATVMGCNDCHTPGALYGDPDFSRRLSGSEVGWKGPWGVTYPRNLTPDLETGLGYWKELDIVDAVRTGHRPDGSVLLPPMPWQTYSRLTDPDAHAIAAYLMSLPIIEHKVPDRVPPGQEAAGSIIVFPPPSVWDAPKNQTSPAGK